MTQRLKGKVAIVTGGARGMGEATVRKFVDEGAKVLIADVQDTPGQALADQLGASARFCHLDVSDEANWLTALAAAEQAFGPVTALVNNAAILAFRSILDLDKATFMKILEVNLVGTFLGVKTVGGAMVRRHQGAIVNISSIDGMRGANMISAYASSKWGVRGFTKAAALEYGPRGVRVNSIHPGGVNTAMGNPTDQPLAETNTAYGMVPLQRIGLPIEIAQASAFLVSDEASYINGAELAVDGGWTAGIYHAGMPGAPDDARYGEPGVEHALGKMLDDALQAHIR